MSNREVLTRRNRKDERGCKGKKGGRKVAFFHWYFLRVKGTPYGEESLVCKSENRVLNGGITEKFDVGGVEVYVVDKFSR